MSIRKHPTKPGYWQIFISQGRNGKKLVFPIKCDSEADALAAEQKIRRQIRGERMQAYPTLLDALPDYLIYYKTIATEEIVKDFTSVMRRELLPVFGRYLVHQILPTMVYGYTAKRLSDKVRNTERTVTHRTIEKELNYLSAMCRWMHVNGMAEKMPLIPKPPKAKTQPKVIQEALTLEELDRLLNAVSADKRPLLLLMSDAGLRMSEALNLKVGEIDAAGRRIKVKGKGGKVLIYPILTDRLYEALNACSGDYVAINAKTGEPYGSLKTMLTAAARRAGISKRVTHHTLRHTFSVLLMEAGISTEVRQLLMRHSSLSATQHYTHVSPVYMEKQAAVYTTLVNSSRNVEN